MARYFIEVSYKGTEYAGFQVQKNANTIQAEIEKALKIYFRQPFILTGSSRTDTGVHALQNFFHFDFESLPKDDCTKAAYRLNAILPGDIVIKNIKEMEANAHCRFDADYRWYEYSIYHEKNPFLAEYAYYYPYKLQMQALQEAADLILQFTDFSSFSKRNTQVKSRECNVYDSQWELQPGKIIYSVKANRFLRGMVRGLVGTMLRVGRGKITPEEFKAIINNGNPARVDFSVPGHGLMLKKVHFKPDLLPFIT